VFFAIAFPSMLVTTLVIALLKWLEKGEDSLARRVARRMFGVFPSIPDEKAGSFLHV
jgi:hypothetical protein